MHARLWHHDTLAARARDTPCHCGARACTHLAYAPALALQVLHVADRQRDVLHSAEDRACRWVPKMDVMMLCSRLTAEAMRHPLRQRVAMALVGNFGNGVRRRSEP